MKFQAELKTLNNTLLIDKPKWVSLEDGEYQIEITTADADKTNKQRNYFFALVKDIARNQDGTPSSYMNWYALLLKMAHIKVNGVKVRNDALDAFKTLIKYFVIVEEKDDWSTVEIYKGVSEMNREEMRELIEVTLRYASKIGVHTDSYYNLKGQFEK